MTTGYDVIVLAGGRARRMGADKTRLVVGGASLLDHVLTACSSAERVVVVGPERPVCRPVSFTQEAVPGGGPVPAVRAGLGLVTAERVVLLAADLPFLTSATVEQLAQRAPAVVTAEGREQWLCGGWMSEALRQAVDGATSARLGDVLTSLRPSRLDADDDSWVDCDTPEDLDEARRRHG